MKEETWQQHRRRRYSKEPELTERIAKERKAMNLRPWEYAPSEVDDGPNPFPPGAAGHASWIQAQRWRAELKAKKAKGARK